MKKNILARSIEEAKNPKYITEEEHEILKRELAERIKDTVFAHAEQQASKALNNLGDILNLPSSFNFEIIYKIKFCAGDCQQILAKARRSEKQ